MQTKTAHYLPSLIHLFVTLAVKFLRWHSRKRSWISLPLELIHCRWSRNRADTFPCAGWRKQRDKRCRSHRSDIIPQAAPNATTTTAAAAAVVVPSFVLLESNKWQTLRTCPCILTILNIINNETKQKSRKKGDVRTDPLNGIIIYHSLYGCEIWSKMQFQMAWR